jgi:hypothetical protein
VDVDRIHQGVDAVYRIVVTVVRKMRVTNGGEDGLVTEDFLNVEYADARFNQMCGIAVT